MVTDGSKQLKGSVIPPGEILVQKFAESRAPELESLYSTIANRLNNNFKSQRNKRRRTTGYDNRTSKTRFRKKQKVGFLNQASDDGSEKSDKKALPRHIRRRKELSNNPESGFCTSGDGTKRLRTHVWHAKRFTMTKRWGYHLALGLHGRGRGSRSLLKWLENGTVVHDASYYSAVQLEGSQDSLVSILGSVMTSFPSSDAENVLSGEIYANSMLHHAGAPIAPVIYMWQPTQQLAAVDVANHGTNGLDEDVMVYNRPLSRLLWIWMHAAALTEGYNALKSACESQGKIHKNVAAISCTSLEGLFGTLEVMGSKASQLLQKILHPAHSDPKKSSVLKKCTTLGADGDTQLTNTSCSGIFPLAVSDPRSWSKDCTGSSEFSLELGSRHSNLWDASKGLCCPVQESVLCMEKHNQRLSSFCLTSNTSNDVNASIKMRSSRVCPLLLLRRNDLKTSVTRWSIILPLSWVKAFWVPLILNGAQAIGLRERSWVACEAGIPRFPSEFPECGSYASLMDVEAAEIDKQAALRPASVRPVSVPIPPPWNCICLAFGTKPTEADKIQVCYTESDMVAETASPGSGVVVARSPRSLVDFLDAINSDHLPLFPHFADQNTCISKMMKNEKILDQCPNTANILANRCRKACFVRVILRAYKEGVIEDGAVICAPRLADIKLWICRCNSNKVELQVPHSSTTTYFVKQESGKWEFQVPENPAAMESNRWPIGFATTGFVRGSKKPSAGGLCDAVLLAHLRNEQWCGVSLKQRKKEVYVLTRNLRSTAYRLALASIVLEHRHEDLDHI